MDIADYWLLEKDLVHKLFKVLVPRYENYNISFTKVYKAPKPQFARVLDKVVLELRGNPYPDLVSKMPSNRYSIQNILLDAAKHDYKQAKISEMAKKIGQTEQTSNQNREDSVKELEQQTHGTEKTKSDPLEK